MNFNYKEQAPSCEHSTSKANDGKLLLSFENYMNLVLSATDQTTPDIKDMSFNDFMTVDLSKLSENYLYGWIDLASKFVKRKDKLKKGKRCDIYARLGEAYYIIEDWGLAVQNFSLSEKLVESGGENDESLRLRKMYDNAIDKLNDNNTKNIKLYYRFFSVQLPYTNDMWSSSNKEEEKLIKEKLISNMKKMIEFALQFMKDPKFQEIDKYSTYKKNDFYLRLGKIYFLIGDYCNAIKYFKMNTKLFGEDGEPRDGQKFDTYGENQVMLMYKLAFKKLLEKANGQMTKDEKSSYEKDLDDLKKLEDTVKFLQNYNSNCRMH